MKSLSKMRSVVAQPSSLILKTETNTHLTTNWSDSKSHGIKPDYKLYFYKFIVAKKAQNYFLRSRLREHEFILYKQPLGFLKTKVKKKEKRKQWPRLNQQPQHTAVPSKSTLQLVQEKTPGKTEAYWFKTLFRVTMRSLHANDWNMYINI